MAYDEDLFDDEFDFGDDDESDIEDSEVDEADSEVEEESPKPKRQPAPPRTHNKDNNHRAAKKPPAPAAREPAPAAKEGDDDEFAPEAEGAAVIPAPPGPPTDHVVHIYEFGDYKRTIQREFTDEDSIKFAEEFNRTSKNYGRHAVPVERDEKPDPHL